MKLLLDTHTFLWYINGDPKLPRYAADAIRDKSNEVYLSVVSVWEALVKYQIGKLALPAAADEYLEASRATHRIADLALDRFAVSQLL
jgi:PIN domain nuclease of toxin-antitoxin system